MQHPFPAILALATVAGGAVAVAAEPPAKPEAKEKLICDYQMETGSHIKRRTCMTESARKERQRHDQERAEQMQNRQFKTNVEAGP